MWISYKNREGVQSTKSKFHSNMVISEINRCSVLYREMKPINIQIEWKILRRFWCLMLQPGKRETCLRWRWGRHFKRRQRFNFLRSKIVKNRLTNSEHFMTTWRHEDKEIKAWWKIIRIRWKVPNFQQPQLMVLASKTAENLKSWLKEENCWRR